MGFQQGLSGLSAASRALDTAGNNIANSNTVGFKQSQTHFADVFANSLAGGGALQVGIGANVSNIAQEFSQGNISVTNNPLDMVVNGDGFFRMSEGGAISFTRAGQFHFDKDGFIVNDSNQRLTGYAADAAGAIVTASAVELQLSTQDLAPQPSANLTLGFNLNAADSVIAAAFNPIDPTTFNSSTSLTVFDSLGASHVATFYFKKTAGGAWDTLLTVDGAAVTLTPSNIQFNTSGQLTVPATGVVTSAAFTPTGAAAQTLTVNIGQATQFGAPFGVNALSQDGFASGTLSGFSVSGDGILIGRYSNGQARNLGQVVLASFANTQGLQPLGDTQWAETSTSGAALTGEPGTGGLGLIQSAAVEDSNVDLTKELVALIIAQQMFQANAQTIQTQDQADQSLINIR
ncbi:MAG: flagellar hook protein FlgE [Burkholderiales bacterium]